MPRHKQDEDVAGAEFLLDLRFPAYAARHEPVEPEVNCAGLDRWLEIVGYKRQPLDLALGRMLRLVRVGVADDDERLSGLGRHGGFRRALMTIRANARESRRISLILP